MVAATLKGGVNGKKRLFSDLRIFEPGETQVGLHTTLLIERESFPTTVFAKIENLSLAFTANDDPGTNHAVRLGRKNGDTGRSVRDRF